MHSADWTKERETSMMKERASAEVMQYSLAQFGCNYRQSWTDNYRDSHQRQPLVTRLRDALKEFRSLKKIKHLSTMSASCSRNGRKTGPIIKIQQTITTYNDWRRISRKRERSLKISGTKLWDVSTKPGGQPPKNFKGKTRAIGLYKHCRWSKKLAKENAKLGSSETCWNSRILA